MRVVSSVSISAYLLTVALPTVHAITLDQWQPIYGFTQDCVNAYNTPLSDCTASDFENGTCSADCIAFLEALTKVINAECGGTSALPNTLIGSFFKNQGTSTLCPNVLNGGEGGDSSITQVGSVSTDTGDTFTPTLTYTPLVFTTASLPASVTTPTFSTSFVTSSPSSTSAAATTTQIAIVSTTVASNTPTPAATTTQIAILDTTVPPDTVASAVASASSSHSHTHTSSTTTSSNSKTTSGSDGNGGGSPLDVGSSTASNHKPRMTVWVLGLTFVATEYFVGWW